MAKNINLTKTIVHAIEGAIVGIGAILPGISGGVLCVAFGLYEPLMELLTHPKKALKENYRMFIPFLIGWALGFVSLAGAVNSLFELAPDVAILLFFGLVCGTVPGMFKQSQEVDKKRGWVPFVISLVVSFAFFHIIESGGTVQLPANFFSFLLCGFMWGLSLIVPGLSSSTVLMCLGLFEPLMEGISNFDFSVLVPFVIGIVVTALALARLVYMLFKKHYALMLRIILGFVVSSSIKTLPHKFTSVWTLIISIICCVIGFVVAFVMENAEKKHKQ